MDTPTRAATHGGWGAWTVGWLLLLGGYALAMVRLEGERREQARRVAVLHAQIRESRRAGLVARDRASVFLSAQALEEWMAAAREASPPPPRPVADGASGPGAPAGEGM